MMGSSTSLGLIPPTVKIRKGAKTAPTTKVRDENRPSWCYSEFTERWCKTEELLRKEQRDAERTEKLNDEASQLTSFGMKLSAVQAAEIRA